MAMSSPGNPANREALLQELDPTLRMHGNQPGVPTATPGSFITQTQQTPGMAPVISPSAGPYEPPGSASAAKSSWGPNTPEGFDAGKMSSGHSSPKYQIGQVASRYDPKAGITPEMLAELNALGLGTFSGGKDKLYVGGNVDPRFEGYTTIDMVRGFNGPGGGQAWQYGAENPNAPKPAPAAVRGGMSMGAGNFASGGVNSLLSGDPYGGINEALGKITQGGQVNIEALLRQLQGV